MKQRKGFYFLEKVNDSVLTQLEMIHNLVQMFKIPAIQGDTSKKETPIRIYQKNLLLYCLI